MRRSPARRPRPAPLWLKLSYAGGLGVLLPVYRRQYGWANFLWFSDLALFSTAASVLLDRPGPAGMAAVGALPLEILWAVDYALRGRLIGLSSYMFDRRLSRFVRGLSLFHLALPPTLLWILWRQGYDRRSLRRQTLLAWLVLPLSFFTTDPQENVNWVLGPVKTRRWLPPGAWLLLEMVAAPLLVFAPMHALLRRFFAPSK